MNAHFNFRSSKRTNLFLIVLLFSALLFIMPANASIIHSGIQKATVHQPSDPFQTAMKHAELAVNAKSVIEIQMHLHHALICLEGKTEKD